jgi:glyoxylase I family protein
VSVQLAGFAPLIQVYDMPTSVAFYRDILGFEVAGTSPARGPDDFDWGLLRRDGIELMLNTAYEAPERPPQPDPDGYGICLQWPVSAEGAPGI